ncbi:class I SAM-dependent methyltransferase [Alkalimarinus alittae]|uniref:Uncharacterized protein n=1 Tax=Alkalimarinus alittae TaxID=2961619 RepID=A0ABY6MXS7_9ALTE|nr:class I SAM-dependent methyltransferase [Alkalimarinus alittae]UZE94592.1 hypothetical protein NKI27_10885 [Alkalimarinus alittae]
MNLLESQTAFITTLIKEHAPQDTLQLGLGNLDLTLSVCQALNQLDNAALTLITPSLSQHSSFLKEMNKLKIGMLSDLVELIRTPADEVLPDFYFQNRTIDLAIINENEAFDQALVAFYYVDKMLVSKGTVIINDADSPVMKKLCRYLVTEREYTLQRTLESTKKGPVVSRLLRKQFNRAPEIIKNTVKTFINSELLISDEDLGLECSMVALTKRAEEGEIDMDFDTLLESIINE